MTNNEINEAVALKLGFELGCDINGVASGRIFKWRKGEDCPDFVGELPDYCGSIEAAWEIVEHIRKIEFEGVQRYSFHLGRGLKLEWEAGFFDYYANEGCQSEECPSRCFDGEMYLEEADAAPMAIALAFLKLP